MTEKIVRRKGYLRAEFKIPLYETRVVILRSNNLAKHALEFNEEFGPFDYPMTFIAQCIDGHQRNIMMLFHEDHAWDSNTIAHECFHATMIVMRWCGIKLEETNHEAGAYVMGWLMAKVVEILQPKPSRKARRK